MLQRLRDNNLTLRGRKCEIGKHSVTYLGHTLNAILESVKRFQHYLMGREFVVLTDHKPLEWLAKQKSVGRLWRWAVMLQEFDFLIQYRPGSTNDNADALSRSTPNNSDDPNQNASHEEVHCALTGISQLSTMEEIRIKQLNDPVLGKYCMN